MKSVRDVRRELASVYWLARNEQIPSNEAAKLCFLLVSLGRLIADSEFEVRLAALEAGARRASDDD